MKNIFFVYNDKKENVYPIVSDIINYLKGKNLNIYVECLHLAQKYYLDMINEEVLKKCDLAIILGGDGTVLKFARDYGLYQIPILGINIGRVGALATAKLSNYKELIEKYLLGDYYITRNLTLSATIEYHDKKESQSFIVYNDIVVHRGAFLQMLPIELAIDNTKFDHIYADGIIVATPSGSSAYNFSAGGPLLSHNSNCYVITPICSQTRDFSSLVVSENEKVCLRIKDATTDVFLALDGSKLCPLSNGDKILVEKTNTTLNIVNFYRQYSMYETVYKVMSSNKREDD